MRFRRIAREVEMKKALIAIIALLVLLPVILRLLPKPFTFERFQDALKSAGFVVEDARKTDASSIPGAAEQFSMVVNGAQVDVYRFEDEGKIATQLEYNKPDAGQAIVESWHLAEAMGAAKSPNKPVLAARNRMFMLLVTHEDNDLRERIGRVFNSM
jgi:hypothetical protein